MKKIIKLTAALLIFCLIGAFFASCSSQGTPLMSFADKTLTVNHYQLLLTRMKGTLASYGYEVEKDSFWRTVISADGMTWEDYFEAAILEEASRYLIAGYLFDRNGLILDAETEAEIDALMDKMIDHAGSETALNSILKDYGVNVRMLREVYVMEAKTNQLKAHLYGEDADLVSEEIKTAYLEENYVAFGQIFLGSYYYLADTDTFGDTVYYTDEKHTAIAYDREDGKTLTDEFGKTVTDIFGDPVYYDAAGRIAYDKENGVVGYLTDEDGDKIPMQMSDEEIGVLYDRATAYAEAADGNLTAFLSQALLYDESAGQGDHNYLYCGADYYGAQGESFAYLDQIAEQLSLMQVGETAVVQSDYGFHIICKYDFEERAWEKEAQKEVFADFAASLTEQLFIKECERLEGEIVIDSEALASVPSLSELSANTLY